MRVIIAVVISLFLSACATGNQSGVSNDKAIRISKTNASNGKKVALVIGNKEYQKPFTTLSNTVNDAKAMKDILETRGFKVIYKTDVTKREFDNSLEEFYRELRRGAIGLLYFSGHGLESNGQNYLIPTDSNIKAKSDTEYEAIALNKITKRMQSENDKLNIVILDACRNDPFAKALGIGGLAKSEPPVGLFVSYATKAGAVSSDGRVGGNGLFTTYLIKYMKEPLSFKDVFQKAREAVYEASNKTQFPAIYDNTINVNFYFTLPEVKKEENKMVVPSPSVVNISKKTLDGWFIWGKNTHKVSIDTNIFYSKPTSYSVEGLDNATSSNRGGLTQGNISAYQYRGKKVLLSGYIKCQSITSRAFIWMFAMKSHLKLREGDIYFRKDMDWTPFKMVLKIPKNANTISFGLNMSGKGKIWIDNLKFKVVSDNIPEKADNFIKGTPSL